MDPEALRRARQLYAQLQAGKIDRERFSWETGIHPNAQGEIVLPDAPSEPAGTPPQSMADRARETLRRHDQELPVRAARALVESAQQGVMPGTLPVPGTILGEHEQQEPQAAAVTPEQLLQQQAYLDAVRAGGQDGLQQVQKQRELRGQRAEENDLPLLPGQEVTDPDTGLPAYALTSPASEGEPEASSGGITPDAVRGRGRSGGRSARRSRITTAAVAAGATPEEAESIADRMIGNLEQQGKVVEEGAMTAADLYNRLAEQQEQIRRQQMDQFEQDLAEQDRRLAQIDQEIGVLRDMRFDASRIFRDRGAGFSMALGVAVGAAQQTMQSILYPGSNPTNTALQLVNDAIRRDIQEQARNFQRQQSVVGAQRTAYGLARSLTQDHATAAAFAEASAKETAATELSAAAMRTQGQRARLQLENMANEIRAQAEAQKQAALMRAAELMNRNRAGGSGQSSEGRGTGMIAPFLRLAPGVTLEEFQSRVGGTSGYRDVQDKARAVANVTRQIDAIRRLIQEGGQSVLSSNQLSTLWSLLIGSLNTAAGFGALDEGSLNILKQTAPDPNSWRSIADVERALAMYEMLRREGLARIREEAETVSGGRLVFDPNQFQPIELAPPAPPGTTEADAPIEAEGHRFPEADRAAGGVAASLAESELGRAVQALSPTLAGVDREHVVRGGQIATERGFVGAIGNALGLEDDE